jgi:hypothetical protein
MGREYNLYCPAKRHGRFPQLSYIFGWWWLSYMVIDGELGGGWMLDGAGASRLEFGR